MRTYPILISNEAPQTDPGGVPPVRLQQPFSLSRLGRRVVARLGG